MKKEKMKEYSKKGLLIFLAVMLLLSILSRALDSLTVAKVNVGYVNKGPVPYDIEGDGTIVAKENKYLMMDAGLRINSIDCGVGQVVEAGQPLYSYVLEDLEEKKKQLEREYEKISLSLQQEQLGQNPLPGITEEELALQRLAVAERDLGRGEAKRVKAMEDYEEELDKLERDYDKKLEQTEETLRESARLEYLSAKNAYRQTQTQMEEAIAPLEEAVDETTEDYDDLVNSGASAEEIKEAKKAMDAAVKALDREKKKWERDLSYAEAALDIKEEAYDRIQYGGSGLEAVEEQYEASKKQLEATRQSAEDTYQSLLDAREAAALEVENARRKDSYDRQGDARQIELSKLRQRSYELDLEEKQEDLDAVNTLIAQQGQVLAPVEGTVLSLTGEAGKKTTGEEMIRLGTGTPVMEGLLERRQAELMAAGQEIFVKPSGSQTSIKGVLTSISEAETDGDVEMMRLTVKLEKGTVGKRARFNATVSSGSYQEVIPIEALREDSKGFYCLVVGERNTFLGTENVAVRIDLNVLEKSSISAAVEGAVSYTDKLIIGSNKSISENDRVRVVME